MPVKPPASKHTTTDLGDKLLISIPSLRHWFVVGFLGLWLALISAVYFFLISAIIFSDGLKQWDGGALFLLAMWTIGFPFAIHSWLWQLSGKVLVNVGQPGIAISRKVFGWGPTKEYSAAHIKDLRASSSNVSLNHPQLLWYSDGPYAWQSQFGSLAFDYGSKTVRFGAGIEEAEAKQVLAEIFQKFPQYSSETTGT